MYAHLNTQSPASLDAAFPAAEAQRLADRLEFHHTPKHGSWVNMVEIELTILQRQCLRHLPDRAVTVSMASLRNAAVRLRGALGAGETKAILRPQRRADAVGAGGTATRGAAVGAGHWGRTRVKVGHPSGRRETRPAPQPLPAPASTRRSARSHAPLPGAYTAYPGTVPEATVGG